MAHTTTSLKKATIKRNSRSATRGSSTTKKAKMNNFYAGNLLEKNRGLKKTTGKLFFNNNGRETRSSQKRIFTSPRSRTISNSGKQTLFSNSRTKTLISKLNNQIQSITNTLNTLEVKTKFSNFQAEENHLTLSSPKSKNYVRLRTNHNNSSMNINDDDVNDDNNVVVGRQEKQQKTSPKLKILSVKSRKNRNDFDLNMFSEQQLEYLKSKINVRLTEMSSRGGSHSKKIKSTIGDHLIYKPKIRSILADELDGLDTERTDIETPASEPIIHAYKNFKSSALSGNNIGFFKKKRKKGGLQGKLRGGDLSEGEGQQVKKKKMVPILAFEKMMKTGEFPVDEDQPIETNKTVELINKKIQEMEKEIRLKNNFNF